MKFLPSAMWWTSMIWTGRRSVEDLELAMYDYHAADGWLPPVKA